MPYGADNALVKAAHVVSRLAEYRPSPYVDELWAGFIKTLDLAPAVKAALVDPARVDDAIAALPPSMARYLWSATHTTFSPNMCRAGAKTNIIPDAVDIEVDASGMAMLTAHGSDPTGGPITYAWGSRALRPPALNESQAVIS